MKRPAAGNRLRVGLLAGVLVVLPIVVGACGANELSDGTLPPIVTTTSTSTTIAPPTTIPDDYIIQPGDTLKKIAIAFNVTEADLIALNEITDPDKIEAGAKLKIPGPGVVIPTTVAETTTTT